MDRFYIITNSDKDKKLEITEKIADYLKTHHKNCEVQQAERKHEGSFHYTDPDKVPDDTQCIIDRKSTRLNSSHNRESRMPSSA